MNDDIMTMMIPMMGVVMMAGVLQAIIPGETTTPPVEPPTPPSSGYKCPYCEEYFSTMAELIAHINTTHPDMPPFIEVDIGWS